MKKLLFLSITATLFLFTACHKDDDSGHEHENETTEYEYHAHVHSPNTDTKNVNDILEIEVEFESHAGETVHNISVRIYNKDDNTEIYKQPEDGHVHETSGKYEFKDEFELSADNGVVAHTDWVLEAKVWGSNGTDGEVTETVEFHVHPE